MPVAAPARRLRAVLALTTACGALFPVLAMAQSGQVRLPTESDVRDVRTDGLRPDFRDSSDKLRVDLRGRNTVINWDGFNIPEGKEVSFTDGRLLGSLRGDIAVLNRDVSSKPSQLLGKLSSDPNVAVWVHNANGILVGSKAAFNTGSLVLTTLDISPEDFVRAGDSYRLQGSAGSQAAITVEQGAKLRVDGSTRGLVMLAPKIDAHGEFVAEGQDVAFVTASDVTLDYRSGSPLSVTLNRGSAVAGTSQYVRGSVAGNNAIFALASQDTLTDSLLQVSAAVTTASAGSRGIVLSAGKPAAAVSGVTVAGDAAATGGVARLLVDGALRTDNRDADVIAGASGALSLTGAVQTRDNLIAGSGALLEVRNNVTAGGDVLLSGRGVTLGGTDPVAQRAGGQFRVSSTDGDITGVGAVTLRSGDTGDSGLLLETLGSTGGNIALGSASRLIAGDDRRGGVTLSRRDSANSIDIGSVDARALRGAVGSGAVRTGNVNVREALSIGGASVTTGNLSSERAVDVRGSGAVTTGGIASGAGTTVVAGGALTIGGDVFANDDVSLRGSAVALDGATLRSGGGIDVTALNGGITGSRALAIVSSSGQRSDVVKLQAAGTQGIVLADGSSITGGTNRLLDVRIFAASDAPLKLGDVTARSLGTIAALDGATANGGAFRSTGSLTFGRLDLIDGFTAESTGGNLTVGRIAVTGALQGIDLRAAGTLSVQNDIGTSGAVTLSSGAALTLGAIESRDRAVTLTSGGALRADRLTAATGVTATGTGITLGDVRGGTGAVLLTAGTGDLSLGSAAGRRVTLEAAGGVGVAGGLTADAGAIDVSGGRAISVAGAVRSTGGGVRIVSSGGPVTVTGGLSSDAAATLSGTALTLGGTHSARGAYSASASAGGITRNGTGLSIRSDSDASGAEGVTLNAAGGAIDLGDAPITAGGTARLATDGQGITVGGVDAAGLVATGATATGAAIRTGDLRVQGPVTLNAAGDVATGAITTDGVVALTGNAVRFGNTRASSLTATASGGAVNGGDLTVTGPVTLRGVGDVATGAIGADGAVTLAGNALRFGNIRATSLSATAVSGVAVGGTVDTSGPVTVQAAAGALTLGRVVTTQGDVALSALGPVLVQGVNAGGTASIVGTGTGNDVSIVDGVASTGAVTVRSGRDIRTPFIRSATGALTVAAPNGRLAGFLAGTGASLSAGAGQPFSLTVGTDAVLGDVVGGNISITATAITASRIDGGVLPVALNATVGDLTVTGPVTGSTVSLTAAGRALLGSVDASGAVTLGGAQGLSFDRVSGTSISATGGAIRGNALSSTGRIVLQGADVTLDRIDAGTLEAAASGTLAVNTVQAGGDATLSGGAGNFGSLTAGGALGIMTAGALRFDRLAGRSVAATARGGALNGTAVVTSGDAVLVGQSIDLASADTGGSLSATSVASLAIGSVRTTGDATLTAGTTGTFGTVTTGGALGVTSNGALRFDRLAGRTITATAKEGALSGTALAATGDAVLIGGSIEVATVESGGTLSAQSIGSSTIGTVQASGNATLIAGTTGSYGTVTAGGTLSATAAGALRFDRLTGRSVAASSQGGTLTGTAVVARGDAVLGGQSIDIGSVESAGSLSADATAGGLRFGTIAAGGNAVLRATGAATLGGTVATGGAYRVTAGSIALDGVQRAGGEVRLVATGGAITGTSGLTLASGTATGATAGGTPIILDATGGIDLAGATLRAGTGSALALRAGRGQAIRLGSVEAGSLGGFDGSAPTDRLTHDGNVTTGDLTLGRLAVTLSAGDLTVGRIAASGPVSLIASSGSIRGGDLTAGTLEARAGSTLALGSATVGGSATLEAGTIDLRALTAQALTIKTAGTVGGANGGTTALRTTGGDLTVEAGTARLGSVDSAGSATLRGGAIEVRERLSAARALLVEARSALTLQNAAAGADLSLASTGAVNAGDLTAGGALSVDGAGVTIGAARAGGALKASSSGGLSLGSGSGNGIVLDAVGLVRAGALSGGPSVSIRGADAELSGAIQGSSVRFATRDPATTALRIGDGTQGGGFRLSAVEVAQIAADTLAFDSGAGAMEIGTVTLAPGVGRSVEMLSTGDVRVTGQVSASGAGRSIRIGGDGASGNAATIHLIATSDAGGRLLLGDNDLDLRGNRIAAGLAPGFLDTLAPGDAGRAQAQALIGNPNSSLYNSQLGGGFFAPDATTLVAARSMSVRFGDYALFQNTAVPGRASGVTVGSLAAPVTPALRIATFGTPSAASFAFFGDINGITGAGAALLGNPVIDIQPALLPNSRINGCLAGSGAGCLTTIVIQPTLQVFDWDSQAVFGILQDVSLPFTPIIGGNNEALLSGLPALAPETPADAAAPAPTVAAPPQQEPKP
ncbi:filamentous hemagglutinin N-terminal domain-containing protein [Sphingomonas hankookensis]|uniref:two-partner secretion domain-containing protein n=1 Tax=Sphingomonas hankookensis TaxID=563996 RepID=UPI001F58B230|nr:filamentous hemagglutinin N-terminal domain-containing protein [Sphingomonas hankookensis]